MTVILWQVSADLTISFMRSEFSDQWLGTGPFHSEASGAILKSIDFWTKLLYPILASIEGLSNISGQSIDLKHYLFHP